jgi:hypothetical protein
VALSAEKMQAWMAADLSGLDLLVIQIDGIHIDQDLILLAAVGIDCNGDKHPLGVMEGASENAAVCQALIDNLVCRGLDPAVCRLFILDGSRALLKAIRASFGRNTPIQRCQVHYADVRIMRLCRPPARNQPGRRRSLRRTRHNPVGLLGDKNSSFFRRKGRFSCRMIELYFRFLVRWRDWRTATRASWLVSATPLFRFACN